MELIKSYLDRRILTFRTGYAPTEEQREFLNINSKRKIGDVERQWGKTRFICEHAFGQLLRGKSTVIVTVNYVMKNHIYDMIERISVLAGQTLSINKDRIKLNNSTIKVLSGTENSFVGYSGVFHNANYVYVDEFEHLDRSVIHHIKRCAEKNLIMLGTDSNRISNERFNGLLDDFTIYERR